MTKGLAGHGKDLGFVTQCRGQPLKGLNGDRDVFR